VVTTLHSVALLLVIIGAINWGLVGLAGIDLVAAMFGSATEAARIVYVLVGVAGLVLAVTSATRGRAATRLTA
jgi:uncharacterized protein